MTDTQVQNIPFDSERVARWGPMANDYRSAPSGLKELGAAFMSFENTQVSEWTTLSYEEVIYVISGEVTLEVKDGEQQSTVRGAAGDLLTLQKGTTARYSGTPGSRSLVCYVPVDYLARKG
jgi:ethanolamine utilization protein EutQ (cupin superfamily)